MIDLAKFSGRKYLLGRDFIETLGVKVYMFGDGTWDIEIKVPMSGFLSVKSVYADFYMLDDYWPDFKPDHFFQALNWYQEQDVTLGG